jgi:putative transposase
MIQLGIKARRAGDFMDIAVSTLYYRSDKAEEDTALASLIREIAFSHTFYGYRRIHRAVNKKGTAANHKRVYRIYKSLDLQRQKPRKNKRLPVAQAPLTEPLYADHVWALDFIFDTLQDGRPIKCMPVEDLFSRFVLEIDVQLSITADRVILVLEECFRLYGQPRILRSDQGPEFRSRTLQKFVQRHGIRHEFTEKGSPWQNGDLESFNGKFRDECLDRNLFDNPAQAKEVIDKHRIFYNTDRPHSSLGGKTPSEAYRQSS